MFPKRPVEMIDGSEKRNRQLAFELQNSHVCEKRSKNSPHLRDSNRVLDSGFQAGGFRIPGPGSRLCQWNLDSEMQSLDGFRIP